MAPSGFDYSKWDKLELSDDEDDHPGAKFIEENTLRRIKRESHERQEAERAAKVADLEKTIEAETEKLNQLTSEAGGEGKDAEKVKILGAIASARAEIEKEERERKFNADEMCYVASERSLVGAQCKPDAGDSDLDYESYVKKYGDELESLAKANFVERGLEDMAEFFKTNTHLLTEHSMGWMLLKCLRMEMRGDTSGMMRAAKTGYALKSVLDFAEAGKKPMKDAARPFFNRLAEEPRVFAEYTAAYEDYCSKLKERAVAKKLEEEEERKGSDPSEEPTSLEEIPREQRLGPGGLDPVEVFESLPKPMQEAFESGSVDALRDYVNALPMQEARTHMRRMVDSGLWVATPGQEGTALQDPQPGEEED
jgi:cell division cycle protein 37